VILADHETSSAISASMLASNDWRCVWFDTVAAVFVHVSNDEVLRRHEVDFAARHFRPEPAFEPRGTASLVASSKGLRNVAAILLKNGSEKARGLLVLGLQHAHTAVDNDPGNGEAWKMLGQLELMRESPTPEPIPRFRLLFDPVFDLSSVRSTYALKRAADEVPNDFTTLLCLAGLFKDRAMIEAELPVLDRLAGLTTVNPSQVEARESAKARRAAMRASLGPPPPDSWDNLNELRKIVGDLLARGRAATAADYLERASAPESRPWDETDRIATLRLHLGEPAAARAIWQKAPAPPKPAVRQARVAATLLVEGSFDRAREEYHGAIKADPELFEAHYGLAVLEQDAGRADDALKAARRAVATAPTEFARSAARSVVATVTPYASSAIAEEKTSR
jgi:tetratricopeptide (TPR) repeat protein